MTKHVYPEWLIEELRERGRKGGLKKRLSSAQARRMVRARERKRAKTKAIMMEVEK